MPIGNGICSGDAIVGNFSGEQRFDYSVTTIAVNLASRLEGLTRQFNVGVLANGPELEEAGDGFTIGEIGVGQGQGFARATDRNCGARR